jgi:hypothetical protein
VATQAFNLKVNGLEDTGDATNIWHDLILSTGVALKSYIE